MIRVFNNPFLLDFVSVCARMPEDEQRQLEAMIGEKYTVDGASVGNFISAGPKWVIKYADNEYDFEATKTTTLVVGGFNQQRPGVWRDFLLTTPEAWERHWFPITRICRRIMDAMFISGQAHRLECIVPASRVKNRPELADWYRVLGYHDEGIRYGYCADGSDAMAFARVKHGHR
jgi:hypothetical protein